MMDWLLALGVGVVISIVVVTIARRELSHWIKEQISASMKVSQADFLDLATQRLATERTQHLGDLELRKQEVERVVQGLEKQLTRYQEQVTALERDRATKFGSLEQQLKTATNETQRLHQTTAQLTTMLGNAKARGQWGEKTADDILQLCGLQEGIHYEKQKNAPIGRPDFTFLLPDQHKCYMDVKFPLDNYIKLVNSPPNEQEAHKEQFLKDVRSHMKELERRDYADSESGSPDYVLMFIPNEQVYGAINEWMPGLIDEALKKHLILAGPWTLYAQVRLMWQAWQNYYHARAIGDIAKTVSEFLTVYKRFSDRFEGLGDMLTKAVTRYDEIARTSYTQLTRKIDQIEEYRKGHGIDPSGSLPTPDSTHPSELLEVERKPS